MINITLESVNRVGVEDEWNFSNDAELVMHSIHTYPAKFPAFIAKKALKLLTLKRNGQLIELIVFSRTLANCSLFFLKKIQLILVYGFIRMIFCTSLTMGIKSYSITA